MKSNSQQSNLDSSIKNITSFWLFGLCLFYATCHLPHFCSHSLSPHSIKITNNSITIQLIKLIPLWEFISLAFLLASWGFCTLQPCKFLGFLSMMYIEENEVEILLA